MALSAFGPYISGSFVIGGIRTEQLTVYFFAIVLLPFAFVNFRAPDGRRVLVPWLLYFIVGLLGLLFPYAGPLLWPRGSALAGVDNLLLPLGVIAVVCSVVRPDHAAAVFKNVSAIIIWATAINGAIAAVGTKLDLSPYLRQFWAPDGIESVADRASQLGRISGIFNQPAEAGIIYGVAALLAIYRYGRNPFILATCLTLISIGGLLSVSKIFILGGIPIMLLYLWTTRVAGNKLLFVLSTTMVAGGVVQSGLFQQWTGLNYLARLLSPTYGTSWVEFYSAGRWQSGSGALDYYQFVLENSPLVGFGLQGLSVPYDSGWTEAIIVAGTAGLACLAFTYLGIFWLWYHTVDARRRALNLYLAIFLLGASAGISTFSSNRVATVIWILLSLLMLSHKMPEDTPPTGCSSDHNDIARHPDTSKSRTRLHTQPIGGSRLTQNI